MSFKFINTIVTSSIFQTLFKCFKLFLAAAGNSQNLKTIAIKYVHCVYCIIYDVQFLNVKC